MCCGNIWFHLREKCSTTHEINVHEVIYVAMSQPVHHGWKATFAAVYIVWTQLGAIPHLIYMHVFWVVPKPRKIKFIGGCMFSASGCYTNHKPFICFWRAVDPQLWSTCPENNKETKGNSEIGTTNQMREFTNSRKQLRKNEMCIPNHICLYWKC